MASLEKQFAYREFTPVQADILVNVVRRLDQWTDMVVERTDELLHSYGFSGSGGAEAARKKAA